MVLDEIPEITEQERLESYETWAERAGLNESELIKAGEHFIGYEDNRFRLLETSKIISRKNAMSLLKQFYGRCHLMGASHGAHNLTKRDLNDCYKDLSLYKKLVESN